MVVNTNLSRRALLRAGAGSLGAVALAGHAGAGRATEPKRYIVGTSSAAAVRAASDRADAIHRILGLGDIGSAVAGRFPDRALAALSRRSDVRYVEVDGTMRAHGQTLPWGVDRVDAEVAHANGETGSGADVAVLDTGIDSDHPDLQANLGDGKAFVECKGNPRECRYPWDDDDGHGTHCAGIADAVDDAEGVVGISTGATLHAVKVLDKNGSGSFSDVAAGIEYVADQGWDVGSMSLGASSGSQTVRDACQYASDRGVLLVASAGNSGPCTDCVGYPAAYDTVVAVSATDDTDALAGFSSTGPEVELAAPGVDVYSTYAGGGYETLSGTSMSCPHVSGAGGQLMADGYTNTEARDQLRTTAEDVGLGSNESGAGLLDVAAALGLDSTDDLNGGGDTSVAVATDAATNVTDSSATLNGDLTDLGGASTADCYFEYRQSGASTWSTTATQTLSATGTFSDDVSGLSSGTEYEFRAVADASDGDTGTGSTLTFATDSTGGANAPTVDSVSLAENNSGGSPHAEFNASWSVSDADGDLAAVDLVLTDATAGEREDSASVDVGGGSASGTTGLKAHRDENSGHTYEVAVTATDAAGHTSTTATASEIEDGA